jgi:hypothetical protein
MASNKPKFNFQDLPTAYLCDNVKANSLRNQLIKNQVRVSECEQGDLETTFFSDENISLINKQLIMLVFKKSKGQIKISDQSKESLIIVMRYIFIEYAKHLPYNIDKQISELNCRVVGDILPIIFTNVRQRIDYLRDIDCPRPQIPLPINTKNENKELPSITKVIFNY